MEQERNAAPPIDPRQREKGIIRASLVGIGANVALAAGKAGVGLASNSIAVLMDAVNNLTDALSSVITLLGAHFAARKPDRDHPLGHGRIEYLSALVVAGLVFYAGIAAGVESVKHLIAPETPAYSAVSLCFIGGAFVAKVLMGRFAAGMGKKFNSGALTASGIDALYDAALSMAVLASALVFTFTGLSLETYVSLVIAAFILRSGFLMLRDAVGDLLGKRMERPLHRQILRTICQEPEILGAYDLILHSYGPGRYIGSVHVEIPDTLTAHEIDRLERRVTERVYAVHGIQLAAVGIYTAGAGDLALREKVVRAAGAEPGVVQVHGFYLDTELRQVSLDVVLDFDVKDREALMERLRQRLSRECPGWDFRLTLDMDI